MGIRGCVLMVRVGTTVGQGVGVLGGSRGGVLGAGVCRGGVRP